MDQRIDLSEFLRSRRARLRPEDVGLISYGGRRRVPGLRREEIAQLAGVSTAYYIRLEQGHAENVSSSVLDAIAGALRLTEAEREHLNRLVRPVHRMPRGTSRPQRVRTELRHLLAAMDVPAYVLGRRLDIIAWNRMSRALLGDFVTMPDEQRNMAWQVFRNEASRELYDDWEGRATTVVACLRLDAGRYPDDPRLASLIGELSMRSTDFRRLWAAHDVQDKGHGVKQIRHPLVGPLTLRYETFRVSGDPDQTLLTYHTEPGSPSADALRLLADRTALTPDTPDTPDTTPDTTPDVVVDTSA